MTNGYLPILDIKCDTIESIEITNTSSQYLRSGFKISLHNVNQESLLCGLVEQVGECELIKMIKAL